MKKRRTRELTIGAATRYGIAVTLAMALLILVLLLLIPGTAFGNFFQAQTSENPLPNTSVLYQQLQEKMDQEEALILTPLCLFFGGLVMGRLAPKSMALKNALKASAKMAFGLLAVIILGIWFTLVMKQQGHLLPGELTPRLVAAQTFCIVIWVASSLVGTTVGVFWRNRSVTPAVLQKT